MQVQLLPPAPRAHVSMRNDSKTGIFAAAVHGFAWVRKVGEIKQHPLVPSEASHICRHSQYQCARGLGCPLSHRHGSAVCGLPESPP